MNRRGAKAQLLWDIPEDEFERTIRSVKSRGEALRHFNSDSRYAFDQIVIARKIDTSHFVRYFNPQRFKPEQVFVKGIRRQAYHLKRAFEDLGREYKCENPECPVVDSWNGKPLTLQFDHINGNNRDNRLENIRLLCPNCHCQTETWGKMKNRSVA